MAYLIISSVLLVSYVIDGRYAIQSFFLEWVSKARFDSLHSRERSRLASIFDTFYLLTDYPH